MTQEDLVKILFVCLFCILGSGYVSLLAWRWGLIRGFSVRVEIQFSPPNPPPNPKD